MAEHDGQRLQSSEAEVVPPGERLRLERQFRQPAQQGLESHLTFEPRQRRSEAEMSAGSERQVAIVFSRDIQTVGIRETIRIAVRRAHDRHDRLALVDAFSSPLELLRDQANRMLDRALKAEEFLDG